MLCLTEGTPETIRAISRSDLVNFHHDTYQPSGLVLSIVGGVEPQETIRVVGDTLGGLAKNSHQKQIQNYLSSIRRLKTSAVMWH